MKHLLEIKRFDAASRAAAGNMETPLSLKIVDNSNDRKISINMGTVLTEGSSEGHGLEALFAYKLEQSYAEEACNTITKIATIRNGNLGETLNTAANLANIEANLSKTGDSAKLLEWAFPPEERNSHPVTSDFSYFLATNDSIPDITPGTVTIACIYKYLQAIHHIEPCERLKRKLDYIYNNS